MKKLKKNTGRRVHCLISEEANHTLCAQMLDHKTSLTATLENLILNADSRQLTSPNTTQTYFKSIAEIIKPNEQLYTQMNANASNLNQMMHQANLAIKKNQQLYLEHIPFWEQAFVLLAKMDEDMWYLRRLLLELLSQVYADIGEKEKARVVKRSLKNYGEYRSTFVPNKPKAKS
ncbi:hypothetical protein [Helicobacter bizzozeronii]|uniref:hypothetical protein n=1 Tax=Helicobacter bizzozeronii TaxID=56877 RepID=UPI000CF19A88|nr:hypothetical protein [Helicobacter bizzozeronii]